MATLQFPRYYVPRPYQQELHAMWRNKRIGVAVYPRQSGKDVAMGIGSHVDTGHLRSSQQAANHLHAHSDILARLSWVDRYTDTLVPPHSVEFLSDMNF